MRARCSRCRTTRAGAGWRARSFARGCPCALPSARRAGRARRRSGRRRPPADPQLAERVKIAAERLTGFRARVSARGPRDPGRERGSARGARRGPGASGGRRVMFGEWIEDLESLEAISQDAEARTDLPRAWPRCPRRAGWGRSSSSWRGRRAGRVHEGNAERDRPGRGVPARGGRLPAPHARFCTKRPRPNVATGRRQCRFVGLATRVSVDIFRAPSGARKMGDRGFEPRTSALSERRSNQLS